MSSSLLSYSSQGNTFRAGLFINTDQVFTIISFASLFFCEGRAYKSMYIYISRIYQFKGPPYAFWRLEQNYLARERERGGGTREWGENRTSSTPVAGATGSQRCDGKIQVYFFFFFLVIYPKWRILYQNEDFVCLFIHLDFYVYRK